MAMKKNLIARLQEIRLKRGLSIAEFSVQLGIARSTLQDILQGKGNPRMNTVEYIAHQLDLDPLELLSDTSPHSQNSPLTHDQRQVLHLLLEQIEEMLRDDHE